MSITSNIAKKLRTVTGLLTLGTIADGEYFRRSGLTVVGGPGGAAGIGGSTGATDNAILRADGTGGATLQNSGISVNDSSQLLLTDGSGTAPAVAPAGNPGSGFWFSGGNIFIEAGASANVGAFHQDFGLIMTGTKPVGFAAGGSDAGGPVVGIGRQANGVLEINDGSLGGVGTLLIRGRAFASLPASPVAGMLATVTDASTATWGATIAGGGANVVLAFYNGTNWTVMGA